MGARITPTEEQIKKVKELFDAGLGARRIAVKLGLKRDSVRRMCVSLGLDTVSRTPVSNNLLTEKTCKICRITKPINDFRQKIKDGKIKFFKVCKECESNKQLEKIKDKNKLINSIIELINNNVGTRKIAKLLGIDRGTVSRYVDTAGIDISERHNPVRPLPTEKVCLNCPENGLQPICNFKPSKRKNGNIYYRHCIKCTNILNNKRISARRKMDIAYRLRCNMSSNILSALKKEGSDKNNNSCIKYLPYTIKELKSYLESLFEPWMSWENYGRCYKSNWREGDEPTRKWNIDHIIPQTHLLYTSMGDDNFKKSWALENLRPYDAKKNSEEGNNRTPEEIAQIKADIKERLEKINKGA